MQKGKRGRGFAALPRTKILGRDAEECRRGNLEARDNFQKVGGGGLLGAAGGNQFSGSRTFYVSSARDLLFLLNSCGGVPAIRNRS